MPAKALKAPSPLAPYWTGFYVGLHAGWGGGSSTGNKTWTAPTADGIAPFDLDGSGVIGGAQVGYNWQIAPHWVVGLEADFSGTGIRGSDFQPGLNGATPNPGWQHQMSQQVEWLATARGRLGYAWDRLLVYGTGGLAWGKVKHEAFSTIATRLYSVSSNATGFGWTVGGGLEWAAAANWSLRLEYLYYDLDTGESIVATSTPAGTPINNSWEDAKLHVVRAGVNYKFGESGTTAFAAADYKPVAPFTWTGLYAGLHAGYGWAKTDTSIPGIVNMYDSAAYSLSGDGIVGGAQIGYNWQVAPRWVLSIEADISGTGIGDQILATQMLNGVPSTAGFTHFMARDINWLASLRGRLGYTWDRTLAYVTGGAAWGDIHYEAATAWNGFGFEPSSFNEIKAGWTLGGGLERAFTDRWTVRVEYLHYDLDGVTITTPGQSGRVATHTWDRTKVDIVRLGVNYKFRGLGAANY